MSFQIPTMDYQMYPQGDGESPLIVPNALAPLTAETAKPNGNGNGNGNGTYAHTVANNTGNASNNTTAVLSVINALSKAKTEQEAVMAALEAIRSAFGWAYGSYWTVKSTEKDQSLFFALESGTVNEEFQHVTRKATFKEGVGLSGRAWKAREMVFVQDLGTVTDCCRRESAQRAGVKSGICFPVIVNDEVVGTMDFFATETLHLSDETMDVLKNTGRLVSETFERLHQLNKQEQSAKDAKAVSTVLERLSKSRNQREAAKIALDSVRSAFGWAYGSYWSIDPEINALKFNVDSGTVTDEFQYVTQEASFEEGIGLSGRAWKSRDLVFVQDLGTVTDCCRRESAQRAGVRSGVCFPIMIKGQVVGTMDFFALETLSPSEERLNALRSVGRMVSETFERLQQQEKQYEATVDAQAMNRVLDQVSRADSTEEAVQVALNVVMSAFGWAYGSYWSIDPVDNVLRFSLESGTVNDEFRKITREASFKEGVGLSGRAWKARELVFVQDLGTVTDCCRRESAQRAGVKSGVCFPIIVKGKVMGTMDFFATETLDLSKERLNALTNVGQMVSSAIERIQTTEQQKQSAADSNAINSLLEAVAQATDERDAAQIALEVVRSSFGWAYGSYWTVDKDDNVLKFAVESGTVNDEFRRITQTASFKEGVGLSGRTWKARELVFVQDLGTVTDCCRREPAQRAGVKSGVCFPIIVKGEVIGTMDFFATETLHPSEDRLNALRSVGQMVSSSVERTRRMAHEKQVAADTNAVNKVLDKVLESINNAETQADAAKIALDNIRSAFGWTYASYWSVDSGKSTLSFLVDSGNISDDFRRFSQTLSVKEGSGLNGRAWKESDMVFAADLGTLNDCPRSDMAYRSDIKSGVCIPITIKGNVIGTMDYFSKDPMTLSPERSNALRNVGRLLSNTIENLIKIEREKATAERLKGNSLELADFSNELRSLSQAIYGDAENSLSQAEDVSAAAGQVSNNVQSVAIASEEMSASIREIAQNAVQAANITEKAESKAQESTVIVGTLGKSAKEIGNVVEVIKSIASQTNLLALNATIEAASAGDAGKGFAVVANEVKELAKQSASASEDIRTRIEEIQSNTVEAVKAISDITDIIVEISQINKTIASAVEEQSVTTNEITRNVSEAARGSNAISDSILNLVELSKKTAQTAETSQQAIAKLSDMSNGLKELIEQFNH